MAFAPLRVDDGIGFTRALARACTKASFDQLSERERALARQALLDWVGVTLAGSREAALAPLYDEVLPASAAGRAQVLGQDRSVDPAAAALLNGAASHVLDFDDTHAAVNGHASAPVLAAVLAAAQDAGASGRDLTAAYVVGFEALCAVAQMLGAAHFARGFHVTATAGAIGAAAGCGYLMRLDEAAYERAFALAATQSSGLQAVFGSVAKSFNVGRAAQAGLVAGRLAARGFQAPGEVLEPGRGLAAACSDGGSLARGIAVPERGSYLLSNIFKYHAACFLTHASIEGALQLRARHHIGPDDIERCVVTVEEQFHRVCTIDWPRHDLQGKFSLRYCTALALAGFDTTRPASFAASTACDPRLTSLAGRIAIEFDDALPQYESRIAISTRNGRHFSAGVDIGRPCDDLALQEQRLRDKFLSLNAERLGRERCLALIDEIKGLDTRQRRSVPTGSSGAGSLLGLS